MPKKILYLITKAEMGGAQKYVLALAVAAKEKGFDVVVASERNNYLADALREQDMPFREIPHLQRSVNVLKDLKLFWELFRLIRNERPDILHLNSSKVGAVGALVGKLVRVPKIVFTAHGWAFNDPRPEWQKKLLRVIAKFSARFQDVIICVSEYDHTQALAYNIAPGEKLIVVHNGLNTRSLHFLTRKEARVRLGLEENDYVIGTIANFYKTKALDTLVFTAISAYASDGKFVIIGDGPEKEKIERLIEKYRLQNRFALFGSLQDAGTYLKAFDVFMLPSKKEGLPYALLEAMTAKLPCIVSGAGGIPEVIENKVNGILIPHPSPGNLWNAISDLREHKKYAHELGAKAAETIATKFTLKKSVEKTLAIYDERSS